MARNNTTPNSEKQEPIITSGKSNYISILQTERTVLGYGITEDELELLFSTILSNDPDDDEFVKCVEQPRRRAHPARRKGKNE